MVFEENGEKYSISNILDITDRKKAEEALKESEQRLNRSQEIAHLGSWELDLQNDKLTWSDEVYRIFGLKPQEFGATYEAFLKSVHPKDRAAVDAAYSGSLREGKNGYEINHRVVRPDGEIRIVHEKCNHIRDESGRIIRSIGMVHDVTESKKIEETLKRAQIKLQEYANNLERLVAERTKRLQDASSYPRNLIEASLDPLVTISNEGKITDVNKATEEATGCSRQELTGSDFSRYFTEPKRAELGYKQVFSEGFVKDYPLAIRNKSGKIINVMYNATLYKNDAGKIQGVFAAARDITRQKKAEEQANEAAKKLNDAERLAAIGATAGMVGHDIRNPLQAITSDVFLLKDYLTAMPEMPTKRDVAESLDGVEKNVLYINKIVADLQDYARPLNPQYAKVDLSEVATNVVKNSHVPANIKVDISSNTFQKITTEPTFIRRILANLVSNAIQAMPDGGNLALTMDIKENNACLTVADTGVGIPENIKPKLFSPMFTTKSKGQGLGLAVVKRLVEALKGTIDFESEEGKGTKFIIKLPTN